MKPNVYVETTILSYLAARPSRDLVVAAHQAITWDWWRVAPARFGLFVSDAVMAEIRRGDPDAAARRVEFCKGLRVLQMAKPVNELAKTYESELRLPPDAKTDLLHISFAVWYRVDYLVTWNCAHIANGNVILQLMQTNERLGILTPLIVTPDALLATETGEIP